MNFPNEDVVTLKSILTLCKSVGIESLVLNDGKVLGAASSKKVAIISKSGLKIDPLLKIGIGRVAELEKRIDVFPSTPAIVTEEGRSGGISRLSMSVGRTKIQFRCTSPDIMSYPKSNMDAPCVVVSLNKEEVSQLIKAAKTLSAETIIFKIDPNGAVHIECADSTNDQYSTTVGTPAEFVDEPENQFFTYQSSYLTTILDVATRDTDKAKTTSIELVFGQSGSITTEVKDHTILIMPNINED